VDPVADGVWRVTRGFPLRINTFLIREEGGVAVFDTGHKPMGKVLRAASAALGGATRVILGNAHADHRGGANAIGAPVFCHPAERRNVEGDGGVHYFDYSLLPIFARPLTPRR
jgi:hydroxyacylglutathione hydrolase